MAKLDRSTPTSPRAETLRVLYVSAECAPIAQSGGLGEVAGKLPRALARAGHDVRVVIPWYGTIDSARFAIRREPDLELEYGGRTVRARVGYTDAFAAPVYLVGHHVHTRVMYGGARDAYGWSAEQVRFRFFSAATAALVAMSEWQPDVVHLNDYHCGLVPAFLRARGVSRPAIVMGIHNARYQGAFYIGVDIPARLVDRIERPLPPLSSPRARFVNFLRRGIAAADLVVPVSPTYARELADPRHIDGLAGVLPAGRVVGIVNGVDTDEVDPMRDRGIARRYGADSLDRRATNKRRLQRSLGFAPSASTPLLAMVARIDYYKGIDLLLRCIEQIAARGAQAVITGNGSGGVRGVIEEVVAAAPGVLAYRPFELGAENGYYAGADMVLSPSRYEACGLVQLKALRYGAIPIVRRVGGLADTVLDHVPGRRPGTGFVFDDDDPNALMAAIDRALATYRRPSEWRALQRRGMASQVGWDVSARRYEAAYRQAIQIARRRGAESLPSKLRS